MINGGKTYEPELWDAFRGGNEKALEELFGIYYSVLLNYGHKFTLNPYLIEESVRSCLLNSGITGLH